MGRGSANPVVGPDVGALSWNGFGGAGAQEECGHGGRRRVNGARVATLAEAAVLEVRAVAAGFAPGNAALRGRCRLVRYTNFPRLAAVVARWARA